MEVAIAIEKVSVQPKHKLNPKKFLLKSLDKDSNPKTYEK